MNQPAQPAPEGATDAELDGLILQMMTAPPHSESVSQHARTILRARLAAESAAIRARCERLEGALKHIAENNPGNPGDHARDALAQPEDGK